MSSKIPPPPKKKKVLPRAGRCVCCQPFCWGGGFLGNNDETPIISSKVSLQTKLFLFQKPKKKTPRGANLESSLESDVLGANHFWKYHFWYLFGMNIGMSHQKKSANNKKCCCNQWETKNVCRDPRGQRWFLGKWSYNS